MKNLKKIIIGTLLAMSMCTTACAINVTYTSLGVPKMNSSWKTWMDYRKITNRTSNQYKFVEKWAWSDYDGFMRCDGESDLGITDNYYVIALGSYYGTTIGTKYRITTDTGNVFYGVLGECKADIHTNYTHQYATDNNDVVEFVVNDEMLHPLVKSAGNANVYIPLNGKIKSIERINFVEE